MSSAAENKRKEVQKAMKIPASERERFSIGAVKALLGALMVRNPKDRVSLFTMLSHEDLEKIRVLAAERRDEHAARVWSSLMKSEAGLAVSEMREALSYLLDFGEEKKGDGPSGASSPAGTPTLYWKPVELAPPKLKDWDADEEMGGGGWRDWTIPLQYEAIPTRKKPKEWKSPALPEKALPNASLVRALSAHRRTRAMNHPDGEEIDMGAMVEVASRIPGANPWKKTFHKASIPHLVVLVDTSGSMSEGSNNGITHANYASTVLALSALVARCPFDIIPYEHAPSIGPGFSVSWRPGQQRPQLPIKFIARGGNDMMGSTILAAQQLFSAPDRRTRRIMITIADSDIASSCYAPRDKKRQRPVQADIAKRIGLGSMSQLDWDKGFRDKQRWPLWDAYVDMREILDPLGVEAHAMFVGTDVNPAWLRNGGARPYIERFRSAVLCENMKNMSNYMTELATNILSHA